METINIYMVCALLYSHTQTFFGKFFGFRAIRRFALKFLLQRVRSSVRCRFALREYRVCRFENMSTYCVYYLS